MRTLPIVVVLGLLGLGACSPSKQVWMEKFESMMTDRVCAPDFYYTHCFNVTEAECRAVITPIAHTCTMKIADQLPDQMSQESGRKFGAIAGQCIGNEADAQLAKKIRTPVDPKCSDASAWH